MGRVSFAQLNALTAKQLAAICKRYDKNFVNPPDCPSNKAKMVRILAAFFNSPKNKSIALPKELKANPAKPQRQTKANRRKISPAEAKAAWINYWNSERAQKRYPNPQDLEYAAVYDLKTHLTPQRLIDDDRYLGPYGPEIYDYPGIDWGQQSFTDPREITVWSVMTSRTPELQKMCQEYKRFLPTFSCTNIKSNIQGSFFDLMGVTDIGKGRVLANWLNTNINVYDRSLLLAKVNQSTGISVDNLSIMTLQDALDKLGVPQ